jgi:hypothetical protein
MSEPKRYTDLQVWEALHFAGSTNGWIRWEDYARLKAEVDRLRASSFVTAVPVEQYERLIKAGDELRDSLPYIVDERLDDKTMRKIMNRWNAAKECKQP